MTDWDSTGDSGGGSGGVSVGEIDGGLERSLVSSEAVRLSWTGSFGSSGRGWLCWRSVESKYVRGGIRYN
jgi:hypothetical protein